MFQLSRFSPILERKVKKQHDPSRGIDAFEIGRLARCFVAGVDCGASYLCIKTEVAPYGIEESGAERLTTVAARLFIHESCCKSEGCLQTNPRRYRVGKAEQLPAPKHLKQDLPKNCSGEAWIPFLFHNGPAFRKGQYRY